MLSENYNETVVVKRLVDVLDEEYEATGKKEFAIHIASLACEIQPLEDRISQDITVGFGKDLLMFCKISDIREGDRVIRTEAEVEVEYRITGIERYDDTFLASSDKHLEVKIRAFKS